MSIVGFSLLFFFVSVILYRATFMHKDNPEDAETADENTTEGDDVVEEDESDIC